MPDAALLRQEVIQKAVEFLTHAKVVSSPREQKIAFLKSKDLNDAEIEEAMRRTSIGGSAVPDLPPRQSLATAQTSRPITSAFGTVLLCTGTVAALGYGAWVSFEVCLLLACITCHF